MTVWETGSLGSTAAGPIVVDVTQRLEKSSEEGALGKKTMGICDKQQFSLLHSYLTVRSQLTLKPVLNLVL